MASEIEQETSNRTKEKAVKTIELIKSFTGKCPKDFRLIAHLQEVIEKTLHQSSQSISDDGCLLATIATDDGSLFEKLSDWSSLPPVEKNNHKNFLEENYSPEDLQLAYDEYFARHGRIPALRDFRVFILQWQVEMHQKNIDLESDNSNLNLNQENFRMALDHAVHVSTEQQNQLQNLITDRLNLQRRFEQAIDTAGQLNTINQQHVTNNGLLQNTCARLIGENNQVNTRCNRLQQDNRRKDMQNAVLDKENVHLSVEVAEKDTTIKQKDTTIKQKDTSIKQKDITIEHLTSQNEQKDSSIEHLTSQNEQKDSSIEHLTSQNEQKDSSIEHLTSQNEQKDSSIEHLTSQNEHLTSQNEQKDSSIEHLTSQNEHLTSQNEQKDSSIEHLTSQNEHLTSQNEHLTSQNEHLTSQNEQKDSSIEHLTSQNEQKDSSIEHLTSQNEQKDSIIDKKDMNIAELSVQNKEKDGKIKDMKCMNKKLNSDLQVKQELCDEKDRQLKKQCLVTDGLHHEMSATSERLANLEKGLESKKDEIERLRSDNLSQNKHISEQDKMIRDLNDKAQSQDKVNQDLFQQLQELKMMLLTVNQRQEAAESGKTNSSS
ncbi:golgin subfamily A member 6-like protein 7 [Mytilus californianus]|uniref:golgin subfamily A member 6-like protein 7 n=1 Tax=Mytilus californianus TaxID=6549 RepID=UPI00224650BB|nr:golgin subfamily A member 6-like protein 7 [Mytilus californianus]